jgi:group I intron endonuclease
MYCIYVFSDENCLPKYVGKTKCFKTRIKQHLNKDRFIYKSYFYNWLNKQLSEDKEYFIDILEEVNDSNWQEKEKYWIKHIKENGYKLTNMTDGGDGNNNQIFTEESKEKRRQKRLGHKLSEHTKKLISEAHKGKIVLESTKQKLRDINLGKPCPEHVKEFTSKKLNQYTLQGIFIKTFNSLTEASLEIGCRKSSLSNAIIRNKTKKFKGFLWEYKLN